MKKELSKQFTQAYLNDDFSGLGFEHLAEAIDNLPDGYVVFTTFDSVEIYNSLDDFAKNNKKLLVEIYNSFDDFAKNNKKLLAVDDWITFKEGGSIDIDDFNITIVR